MKQKIFLKLSLMLIITVSLFFIACSMIGLGIGSLSDAQKPDKVIVPGWKLETVKQGTAVTLLLKDGRLLNGIFAGTVTIPEAEYAERYLAYRSALSKDLFLPALGDSVTVVYNSGTERHSTFAGLGINHLLLDSKNSPEPERVSLNGVRAIRDRGDNFIDVAWVKDLLARGGIPSNSQMLLKTTDGNITIAIEEVEQIQVRNSKNGKLLGFAVGAIIDAVVIAAIVSSDEPNNQSSFTNSGNDEFLASCPFIYSFDGEQYRLDSETFGGAIFQAAQRSDWDNLDYLQEYQGRYRLLLTNELQETQYVDALKLLVVDHPLGTQVMPTFCGELHLLSEPQEPLGALDFQHSDIRSLVAKTDGAFWISKPLSGTNTISTDERDGMILTFTRPPGASQVKLAVNVQNTVWASYLQGQMLALQGRDLDKWYETLNTSAKARQALQQVMIREGMLRISLWNGESWQKAGYIWEVGPSLPKDEVVTLDIQNTPADTLRVMLSSTAGFWMIDRVAVDYSTDAPFKIEELTPEKAVDETGRDVLHFLSREDGNYYVMPKVGNRSWIKFTATPRYPNLERSFVLKASGYYTIHISAEGEPQSEAVKRFMSEPGAYGRYTLDLFKQRVSTALSAMERD